MNRTFESAAPVPVGAKKDLCAEVTCEPIVRDCECFKSCEIVHLPGKLDFAHDCPGGAKCDAEQQKALDCSKNIRIVEKLAGILHKYDGSGGTQRIEIEVHGHTDATGADSYNVALSLKRASYARWLLTTHATTQFDMAQLKDAKGYGERCLKIATDKRKDENRRVDFWRSDDSKCMDNPGVSVDDNSGAAENCAARCTQNMKDKTIDASACEPSIGSIGSVEGLGELWEGECPDNGGFLLLEEQEERSKSLIEIKNGKSQEQPGSVAGTECGGKCYGEWEPETCADVCKQVGQSSAPAIQVSRLVECGTIIPTPVSPPSPPIKKGGKTSTPSTPTPSGSPPPPDPLDPQMCKDRKNCNDGDPLSCYNDVWCQCNNKKNGLKLTSEPGCATDAKKDHCSWTGEPKGCHKKEEEEGEITFDKDDNPVHEDDKDLISTISLTTTNGGGGGGEVGGEKTCHKVCHKDQCKATSTNPIGKYNREKQWEYSIWTIKEEKTTETGCCLLGKQACDLCCLESAPEDTCKLVCATDKCSATTTNPIGAYNKDKKLETSEWTLKQEKNKGTGCCFGKSGACDVCCVGGGENGENGEIDDTQKDCHPQSDDPDFNVATSLDFHCDWCTEKLDKAGKCISINPDPGWVLQCPDDCCASNDCPKDKGCCECPDDGCCDKYDLGLLELPWVEEDWLGCGGEVVDGRTLEETCADSGIKNFDDTILMFEGCAKTCDKCEINFDKDDRPVHEDDTDITSTMTHTTTNGGGGTPINPDSGWVLQCPDDCCASNDCPKDKGCCECPDDGCCDKYDLGLLELPWKEEQWLGCEGESVDDSTLEEMCADGGIKNDGETVLMLKGCAKTCDKCEINFDKDDNAVHEDDTDITSTMTHTTTNGEGGAVSAFKVDASMMCKGIQMERHIRSEYGDPGEKGFGNHGTEWAPGFDACLQLSGLLVPLENDPKHQCVYCQKKEVALGAPQCRTCRDKVELHKLMKKQWKCYLGPMDNMHELSGIDGLERLGEYCGSYGPAPERAKIGEDCNSDTRNEGKEECMDALTLDGKECKWEKKLFRKGVCSEREGSKFCVSVTRKTKEACEGTLASGRPCRWVNEGCQVGKPVVGPAGGPTPTGVDEQEHPQEQGNVMEEK